MVKTSAAGVVGCIGLAVALAACSSPHKATPAGGDSIPGTISPGTVSAPAASTAPAPVPAGYKRIGGPVHRLSFAIPDSWILVNPTPQGLRESYKRVGISNISLEFVLQDLANLKKWNGLLAEDFKDASTSSVRYAPNISGWCTNSRTPISGSAGVAILRSVLPQFQQVLHARNMNASDINVGGIPGLEVSFTLNSRAGTLYSTELQVLPKSYRDCVVALTATQDQLQGKVIPVVASTALFFSWSR